MVQTADGGGSGSPSGPGDYPIATWTVNPDPSETDGLKWRQVQDYLNGTNPGVITDMGNLHNQASISLAKLANRMVTHAQTLSGNWSGDRATDAINQFQDLYDSASAASTANWEVGNALSWYGNQILPWYVENAPHPGTLGSLWEDLGGDDTNADNAAQQHLARLNGRIAQASAAYPTSIQMNLPKDSTQGGYGSAGSGGGGGAGGVPGGGLPGGTGPGTGAPGGGIPGGGPGAGGVPSGTGPGAGGPGGGISGGGLPGGGGPGQLAGVPNPGAGGGLPGGAGGIPGGGIPGGALPGGGLPGGLRGLPVPGMGGLGGDPFGGGPEGGIGGLGRNLGRGLGAAGEGAAAGEAAAADGAKLAGRGLAAGEGAAGEGAAAGEAAAAEGGMAGMPMGGGGGGQGNKERERQTWLTEDEDVWGSNEGDVAPPVIG